MATVCHPPQTKDYLLRDHLFQSLDTALAEFPNAGIIILGDFNQFTPGSLCSSFKLKKLVKKPTRGANTLAETYSTLSCHYNEALILPPYWYVRSLKCSPQSKRTGFLYTTN
jgi:hypothetical protein